MSAFGFRKPADLPQTIPLFPLAGAIFFPRGALALNVFEPRYLNMVDDALADNRLIGMIQPASGEEDEVNPALAAVGTRWAHHLVHRGRGRALSHYLDRIVPLRAGARAR